MAEPFLGEIRLMSFNFPPKGWAMCNGQQLPINQNQALFALLGTHYGGNGQTTFALPNLQGRVPIHFGGAYPSVGIAGGEYAHTVTSQEMPMHVHQLNVSSVATGGSAAPGGRVLGGANNAYHTPTSLTTLNPGTIVNTGGSQPHENKAPYAVVNFCIALQGIFPSQN